MNKRIYQAENIGHFFASSVATWATGTDPEDVLKRLRASERGNTYLSKLLDHKLYFVPLPEGEDYDLVNYAPDVPGTLFLGTYKYVRPKQARELKQFD